MERLYPIHYKDMLGTICKKNVLQKQQLKYIIDRFLIGFVEVMDIALFFFFFYRVSFKFDYFASFIYFTFFSLSLTPYKQENSLNYFSTISSLLWGELGTTLIESIMRQD